MNDNNIFLNKLKGLNKINEKIDLIFEKIYGLIGKKKFEEIDDILSKIQIHEYTSSVIIAFLTTTLWLKGRLNNRQSLYKSAERYFSLTRTEKEVNRLLKGLNWETQTKKDKERTKHFFSLLNFIFKRKEKSGE